MADDETPRDLGWYVEAVGEDAPYAKDSDAVARQLVNDFIGGESNPFHLPPVVVERAYLEVGADIYYRKASRNGIASIAGADPQLFRINRDPMASAYPLLRRYLVMGL